MPMESRDEPSPPSYDDVVSSGVYVINVPEQAGKNVAPPSYNSIYGGEDNEQEQSTSASAVSVSNPNDPESTPPPEPISITATPAGNSCWGAEGCHLCDRKRVSLPCQSAMKKFFTVMGGLTCAHCVIKLLRFIANKKQWCQDGDSRCFRCVVPLLGIPLVLIGSTITYLAWMKPRCSEYVNDGCEVCDYKLMLFSMAYYSVALLLMAPIWIYLLYIGVFIIVRIIIYDIVCRGMFKCKQRQVIPWYTTDNCPPLAKLMRFLVDED